jgi:hypothetical protein
METMPRWHRHREEARALYARFVASQKAHDLAGLRATLLDSERFLRVGNGLSISGVDAAIRRMASFHEAPVRRIEPEDDKAVAVEVNARPVFPHIPPDLAIGERADPGRFRFLVSAPATETPQGWRIAAPFTTSRNTEERS